MKTKKAVSPLVSTVLLIMIVIVLALIIIMWSRGFIKEAITKDIAGQVETVDNLCRQIKLSAVVNDADGSFGFTNNGNIPIYSFDVKFTENGSSNLDRRNIPANPGITIMINGSGKYTDHTEIKIIPILLGKIKSGSTQEFTCPDENGIVL